MIFSLSNIQNATNYALNLNYVNMIEVWLPVFLNNKSIQDGLDNLMTICMAFVKYVENLQVLLMKIIKIKRLR